MAQNPSDLTQKGDFKMKLKQTAALLAATAMTVTTLTAPATVHAAPSQNRISASAVSASSSKTFVSLGADLSASQKQTVLKLLNLDPSELNSSKVLTITNREEHQAYDNYLPKKAIGAKALSSSKVTSMEDGYGIQVETHNISYVTTEMYQNALATAGMKNAKVVVAAPTNISGTAALLGVTKAYSELTGKSLKADAVDAAAEEIVVTGKLGDKTGDKEKAAQLIASVKEQVASGDLDEDQVDDIITKAAKQLNMKLTPDEKSDISKLMSKIDGLNLSVNDLKKQAGNIYDKLQQKGIDLHITKEKAMSWLDRFLNWAKGLWNKLKGIFD
jgi:uncharacterized protein YpuA (DUF1002 family)